MGAQVPPVLLKLFRELEFSEHHMSTEHVYSLSGNPGKIKELLEALTDNLDRSLSKYDTETIACSVKYFLRHCLTEPLVPFKYQKELLALVKTGAKGKERVKEMINQMDQPVRDTLSLVMIHIESVITQNASKEEIVIVVRYLRNIFRTGILSTSL